MKKKLYFLFYTSIFKTIIFNFKYFGFASIFKPKVFLSKNVKLVKMKGSVVAPDKTSKCHIGYATNYLFSSKPNKTIFYNDGKILISQNFCISKGCSIVVKKNGCLKLGDHIHISQNTQIECHFKITLCDACVISWDCLIMDSDTHPIYTSENKLINENREIIISAGAWVCCRCTILKGSILGENDVLSASSIYTKQITEKNVVIVNNRIAKKDIQIRMKEDLL